MHYEFVKILREADGKKLRFLEMLKLEDLYGMSRVVKDVRTSASPTKLALTCRCSKGVDVNFL